MRITAKIPEAQSVDTLRVNCYLHSHVYTCIIVYAHAYTCIYKIHVYAFIPKYTCPYIYMYLSICIGMYSFMHASMYACSAFGK